jgi:hypothetical protein
MTNSDVLLATLTMGLVPAQQLVNLIQIQQGFHRVLNPIAFSLAKVFMMHEQQQSA